MIMTNIQLQAMIQHDDESLFVNRGLRDYFSYRDLGIATASNGRIIAQINRANYKLTEEGELHHHVLTHQINLVLKGNAIMKFEGIGEVALITGTSYYMPPNIKHTFVSCLRLVLRRTELRSTSGDRYALRAVGLYGVCSVSSL